MRRAEGNGQNDGGELKGAQGDAALSSSRGLHVPRSAELGHHTPAYYRLLRLWRVSAAAGPSPHGGGGRGGAPRGAAPGGRWGGGVGRERGGGGGTRRAPASSSSWRRGMARQGRVRGASGQATDPLSCYISASPDALPDGPEQPEVHVLAPGFSPDAVVDRVRAPCLRRQPHPRC